MIAILFQISGYYLKLEIVQSILPETSPFLSAQMAVLSSFFQMLGYMYNCGFYGTVLNDLELAVFFKTEKKLHYRHQTKSGRAWKNTVFLKYICFQELHKVHGY